MPCLISCMNCGEEKQTRYSTTKFCSDKCRGRYNKKHRGHKRECTHCLNTFYSYKDKKYCSDACKESYRINIRAKKQAEKDIQRRERDMTKLVNSLNNIIAKAKTCMHCGREYILLKKVNGHKYCSDECKEEGYKECRRKFRKKMRLNKDKRLSMNGKIDYSITLDKLHERDEGICYLCNKPTNYNDFILSGTTFIAGNTYPSIDHVTPIAKGGLHAWDNIKLAHRICNSIKQDKVI